jgi:hypothetical protein
VFWRPDAYPRTVVLAPAPAVEGGHRSIRFEPESWPGRFVARAGPDGVHAILKTRDDEHRLWMPAALPPGQPVACVVPFGADAACGTAAALHLWRHLSGGPSAPAARPDRKLQRFQQILRAHDGHLAGGSYREIAEQIFGASRVAGENWRTSPLRDAVIRLVRSGAALVRGDYKRLLRSKHDD